MGCGGSKEEVTAEEVEVEVAEAGVTQTEAATEKLSIAEGDATKSPHTLERARLASSSFLIMSDAVDISDGDTVQTPRGRGQVVKRQGVRVRVEYSDGIKWEEIKNVERVAGTKEVFSAADGRAEAEGGDAVAAIAGDLFRVIDKDRSGSIDRHEFISFLLVTSDHTRIGEWWALLSEHARQAQGPRVGKAASSGGGISEAAFKSWASANPQHLEEISRLHQASKVTALPLC